MVLSRGLPLIREPIAKLGRTRCHPGKFIREEILHGLRLSVARAAAILAVRLPAYPTWSTARPPFPRAVPHTAEPRRAPPRTFTDVLVYSARMAAATTH